MSTQRPPISIRDDREIYVPNPQAVDCHIDDSLCREAKLKPSTISVGCHIDYLLLLRSKSKALNPQLQCDHQSPTLTQL